MTDIVHAFAQSLIARDTAVAHAIDEQIAALRDKTASILAAHEAGVSERNTRHQETVGFLGKLNEAENAAASAQRDSIVAAFTDEIDRLTKLSETVVKGEAIIPVAAQLRVPDEPPATDLQRMDPGEFDAAIDKIMGVEVLPPEETHTKPKIVRAA